MVLTNLLAMVAVYFESSSHADLVAVFINEEEYIANLESLKSRAEDLRMTVTESVISTAEEARELMDTFTDSVFT